MTGRVLTIGTPVDNLHGRRLRAVAAACERLGALAGSPASASSAAPAATQTIGIVKSLAAAGRIAVSADDENEGPWTLSYIPSPAALAAVAAGTAPSWGARVDAKHQKALRKSTGAVFRLPFADPGTGTATGGTISTFTTDWSPFTAACAIAIHPDHEALAGAEVKEAKQRPYFSGRFVRHPLHGDLLPVWVADWAKPEYGTGAVVVNPAHSAADLDFARAVGLPIRFGLGEHVPDADPATWLTPPIIKTGATVRAGRHDGLAHDEAAHAYLGDLLSAGHADRVESASLGRTTLGVLTADASGELRWAPTLRARSFTEDVDAVANVTVSLEPAPLLTTLAEYGAAPTLVAASEAVPADLLWLRLLTLDLAAGDAAAEFGTPVVIPVARVGSAQGIDAEWLDGALLVAGRPDETVSVKAQVGEQIARIAKDFAAAVEASGEPDSAPSKPAAQISEALVAADFASAFGAVGATAKAFRRGTAVGAAERDAFLAAGNVLFGLPLPAGFDPASLAKLGKKGAAC